jgi:hypothetical protein
MIINERVEKLEQNFHHPEAGLSVPNANNENEQQTNSDEASRNYSEGNISAAVDKIVSLLNNNRKKKGTQGDRKACSAIKGQHRRN